VRLAYDRDTGQLKNCSRCGRTCPAADTAPPAQPGQAAEAADADGQRRLGYGGVSGTAAAGVPGMPRGAENGVSGLRVGTGGGGDGGGGRQPEDGRKVGGGPGGGPGGDVGGEPGGEAGARPEVSEAVWEEGEALTRLLEQRMAEAGWTNRPAAAAAAAAEAVAAGQVGEQAERPKNTETGGRASEQPAAALAGKRVEDPTVTAAPAGPVEVAAGRNGGGGEAAGVAMEAAEAARGRTARGDHAGEMRGAAESASVRHDAQGISEQARAPAASVDRPPQYVAVGAAAAPRLNQPKTGISAAAEPPALSNGGCSFAAGNDGYGGGGSGSDGGKAEEHPAECRTRSIGVQVRLPIPAIACLPGPADAAVAKAKANGRPAPVEPSCEEELTPNAAVVTAARLPTGAAAGPPCSGPDGPGCAKNPGIEPVRHSTTRADWDSPAPTPVVATGGGGGGEAAAVHVAAAAALPEIGQEAAADTTAGEKAVGLEEVVVLQRLWPTHCVVGSPGADLVLELVALPRDLIVRKGTRRDVDGYSAFFDNGRWAAGGVA
jgi:hypothetical protein